jgi:hypothetical protein
MYMENTRYDTCDGFYIQDLLDYEKKYLKQNVASVIDSKFTCLDDSRGEQLVCTKTIRSVPLAMIKKQRVKGYATDKIRKATDQVSLQQIKLAYDSDGEAFGEIGALTLDPEHKHPHLQMVVEKEGDEHVELYEPLDGLAQIDIADDMGLGSIIAEVDECVLHVVGSKKRMRWQYLKLTSQTYHSER